MWSTSDLIFMKGVGESDRGESIFVLLRGEQTCVD